MQPVASRYTDWAIQAHNISNSSSNQVINYVLRGQNTIGFIKKQRLNWLGHVERMAEDNIVQKIKIWKPMSNRPIGGPKARWEDDFWKIQKA